MLFVHRRLLYIVCASEISFVHRRVLCVVCVPEGDDMQHKFQ